MCSCVVGMPLNKIPVPVQSSAFEITFVCKYMYVYILNFLLAYPSLNAILNCSLFFCSQFYGYTELLFLFYIQLHLFVYKVMDICFELYQHISVLTLNLQYCQMNFNSVNVEKYAYISGSINFLLLL